MFGVPLVGLSAVLRRSQKVHFSLLVEMNTLVYLVMLYGEVISFERGFWTGILNGGFEWGVRGLNGGCMGQSYRTDLDTIELISMSWSFWCLAHFSMTNSSLLNGDPEWGFWMEVLNGAMWGLNGGCTGQSYRADLGTIELVLLYWSFWHLAHFSMANSSLLNGGSERGHTRLERGLYGAVIWGWSWYHWTHLVVLIVLIPRSFSYNWRFSFEWGSCMGVLNGGSERGWTGILNGTNGDPERGVRGPWTGKTWIYDIG